MKHDNEILESMGAEVARALGTGPGPDVTSAQKEALLLADPWAGRSRRRRLLVPALAAAAVLVAAAAVTALLSIDKKPVQFWIGDTLTVSKKGIRLQAPPESPLLMRFQDGSKLEFEGSSSGRLVEATTKKVELVLARGRVNATVRKHSDIRWTIEAGPYRVTVTGTRFTVSWNAETAVFEVSVARGSVVVRGGDIDESLTLAEGDYLHIDRNKGVISFKREEEEKELEASMPQPPGGETPEEAPAPAAAETADPGNHRHAAGGALPGKHGKEEEPVPEWKKLILEGRYKEAVKAAQEEGLEDLLASSSLADLWKLADAARYAHDGKNADRILRAVRTRFPGTRRAKIAAFLLGRVALELKHDPSGGITWLRTYLEEDPEGELAEEALGRLINAYLKANRGSMAMQASKLYLEKYENGAFSEIAKSVLGK